MFRKLFGREEKITEEKIVSPLTGKVVRIEDVPDPTFSQKMVGDGLAVEPSEGKLVSPVDGEVLHIFPTKHAIGLKGKSGAEILIHIGLETVSLNGEGFEAHVKQGDKVKAGELLISFDLDIIKEKAASTITPIVITNVEVVESLTKANLIDVTGGKTELLNLTVR